VDLSKILLQLAGFGKHLLPGWFELLMAETCQPWQWLHGRWSRTDSFLKLLWYFLITALMVSSFDGFKLFTSQMLVNFQCHFRFQT